MLNIVIFGPPGAGKGTQAEFIVNEYNVKHISTGDLFRFNMKNNTALGKEAKSYIEKGNLVPDEVTTNMLQDAVTRKKEKVGFLFDGYPRNTNQAEALDMFLNDRKTPVTVAIVLELEDEILIKRILERGKTSGRADDQDESIIRDRIKVYYKNTSILTNFYNKQNKLLTVNGLGTIEEIATRIKKAISTIHS